MSNFSAAFGYDFFIVPLDAASVDVSFTGITGAANFIDSTSQISRSASVSYANGVFTVDGSPLPTDGTATPVRLAGLTTASLETDTSSEDIYTYDDESKGFNQAVATTKSFSVSLAGIADFKDAGYQILRLAEQNTVADGLRVKFLRVGPTGTVESVYGYGTLMGYTESNEVSSIVSWEMSISGYGPYQLELDANNQPTGGVASLGSLATTNPFDTISGTGVAASAVTGGATLSVDTDGSGNVIRDLSRYCRFWLQSGRHDHLQRRWWSGCLHSRSRVNFVIAILPNFTKGPKGPFFYAKSWQTIPAQGLISVGRFKT